MPVLLRLAILALVGLAAGPAPAAELPRHAQMARHAQSARHVCLTKAEQRAAVASHRAVSLAKAIRTARKHYRKKPEVVRARLCRRGGRLVYLLTLLAPNGKVTRATVDAANGKLIKGHHETAPRGEKRLAPPRRRG